MPTSGRPSRGSGSSSFSREKRAPGPGRPPSRGPRPEGPRGKQARQYTGHDDYMPPASHDPSDIGLGVRLVYEDDEIVVVDKPTGLITAPMPGTPEHDNLELREQSVFGVVKHFIKDKRRLRGTRVWIIHRLDKEASGLLVFAASDRAFEQLKEEFRTKRAHRLYMAVVEGEIRQDAPSLPGRTPQPPSGIIRSFLAEGDDGLMRSVNTDDSRRRDGDPGQNAVTHWRGVGVGSNRTLIQLRLDTGRKNQIRVHMREAGHPLVGDRRYGGRTNPISRLCLHATELGFTHPATGQNVRFFSPPPQSFYGLIGQQPPVNSLGETRPTIVGEPPVLPNALKKGKSVNKGGDDDGQDTSWDHVAEWYDQLIGERKSDHHENVIIPGALRLLRPRAGMRVLDVACGQGDFCRRLASLGVRCVGVDASPRLIDAAREAKTDLARFVTGDARALDRLPGIADEPFDAAISIMAMMNIDGVESVFTGVASMLAPGGTFTFIILHPSFRAPGQTEWGWAKEEKDESKARHRAGGPPPSPIRQYRRVDGYLSAGRASIVMNPGKVARGADPVTTWTFHRPLQAYSKLLHDAGFAIDLIEEWASLRKSAPGPRAAEENRARREIPMFMAVRAVLMPAVPVAPVP